MTNEDGTRDPDLEQVEAIYDALDGENPTEALELARRAMAEDGDDDPVLHFLAGMAALELDRAAEAVVLLEKACELDPDDLDTRLELTEALFRLCRFTDAEREARSAVTSRPDVAHGYWALGLALEYTKGCAEADEAFDTASKLEPQEFPPPTRLDRAAFEDHLRLTMDELPDQFREALNKVAVTVEELPSEAILFEEDPPLDPRLLGLFVGEPQTEQSVFAAGSLPSRILLFQRNLEREAPNEAKLRDEISVTLRHELAHYLGLDEDEIEEAGHA